uniref:Uncharacterized protein n=1 Tax=Anopheles stephensi TaxID=30069 RepID=A0A182Y863_ANOST
MPTMSSTWIDERPGAHGSPVGRRSSVDPSDAFSNISNQSAGSGRSGVRRFGDIFRNRLKLAGAAAMRTFNDSFPQECKINTDEENGVQTPSPKMANAGAKGGVRTASFDALDAVLVNERVMGRKRDRTKERSNTLAGSGPAAGEDTGGLRSRRSSTMFRQRTVHRTPSGANAKSFAEDEVIEKCEPTGKGGHPRHTRKEDKKTKPDDAATVGTPRTTDFHGNKGPPDGERAQRLATHPRTSIVHREPMDEVVVGKPPSRERVNSTSHYSTEKSGSSGYYSTNLYSTGGSSVDEHIYCEPIDRCPRTQRLEDAASVKRTSTVKSASQATSEPVKTSASCDRKRGGNDQELSELQRNIRGLEQYYYPASLSSPTVPVQISVMRASVVQQPLHAASNIGAEAGGAGGVDRTEGCEVQERSQEQQEQQQLSVIMEGNDGQIPRPIWPLDTDDSLMDINLESFRMANHSSQNLIGFESPTLSSISESEMYAMRDQVLDGAAEGTSRKKSQYEEYLEFHNTRNILEQIRGKLNTLLEQRTEQQEQASQRIPSNPGNPFVKEPGPSETELEKNIAILKADLDGYLRTMNQKNENEIRRFCKGMSREPKVVAVQNAVEQRNRSRSGSILSLEHDYELLERTGAVPYPTSCGSESVLPYYQVLPPDICEGRPPAALPAAALVLNRRSPPNPFAQEVRQHGGAPGSVGGLHSLCCQQRYLNSDEIRVCNRYGGCERADPNVAIDMPDSDDGEVGKTFVTGTGGRGGGGARSGDCRSVSIGMPEDEPADGDRVGRRGSRVKLKTDPPDGCQSKGECVSESGSGGQPHMAHCDFNQLQRNITLERIILMESLGKSRNGQFGDKEKMLLEWHQNKPSCWELYYGANREEHPPHQTLIRKMKLGRKSTVCISY